MQVVPRKSVLGSRCGFLHRCLRHLRDQHRVDHARICLRPQCVFFRRMMVARVLTLPQIRSSVLTRASVSRSQPPLAPLSGSCSSVGLRMSSVVSGCVSLTSMTLIAYSLIILHTDGVELILIIVATFGQAVSGSGHAVNIIGVLVVWRFSMGVGIGGDYPLSAVISSEFASTHIRGRMMTAVFANQGWGQFCTFKLHDSCGLALIGLSLQPLPLLRSSSSPHTRTRF